MAGVGHLPGEAFQQDQREGVDVAGRAEVAAGGLFGAEVVRGTYGHPVHRDAGAIQQPRDLEIAQLRDDRRGLVCRWGLLWVGAS